MTPKQEERRRKAIDYIDKHLKTEYKEERDWCLDHRWLTKNENVDRWDAIKAIDIALGIEKGE